MILGDYIEIPQPIELTTPPEKPVAADWSPIVKRLVNLWNNYGGAIAEEAGKYGMLPREAMTVFAVETMGQAFDGNRIVIRVESHIFRKYLPVGFTGPMLIINGTQVREWESLSWAAKFNLDGALLSASWGLPQLMGFNWKVTPYKNVREMVTAFCLSVRPQVAGFFQFCQANNIIEAAITHDWQHFARIYNGIGNVPVYSNRLTEAAKAIDEMEKKGLRFV
uniref:Putative N-acetylmuramidase n=1 Tax=viral metagenome TaxID=1070528 RepID=A0A6H2A1T6_9ZZZZ